MSGKRITIDLDEVEAAAFDMLRAECARVDPVLADDEILAKSMLLGILEDDMRARDGERAH